MKDAFLATRLANRALIRVAGEDVRGFLQSLVTADAVAVAPGTPRWGGLLTPQGKALFDFLLWDDDDAILIDCEAGEREALVRRLSIYRLRRAIELTPLVGAVHWAPFARDGAVPDPRLGELGVRWIGGESGDPADEAWLRRRLDLGVTEGVAELGSGETLWLECNAGELNGVSFTKGCYVGQENTARMHHRAKVSRRLVVAPGTEPGPRTRHIYSELDRKVELRRVDALDDALQPPWLTAALAG